MAKSRAEVTDEIENWQRAKLIGEVCIKEALLDILHNRNNDPGYVGLPEDGQKLYQRMVVLRKNHQKVSRIVSRRHWDLLCPPSGVSNSNDWTILTIVFVIQYEKLIPPPKDGWRIPPNKHDTSKAANVLRAKYIRNQIRHSSVNEMRDLERYNELIRQIEDVLTGLEYRNMRLFYELKSTKSNLEVYGSKIAKILGNNPSQTKGKKI